MLSGINKATAAAQGYKEIPTGLEKTAQKTTDNKVKSFFKKIFGKSEEKKSLSEPLAGRVSYGTNSK